MNTEEAVVIFTTPTCPPSVPARGRSHVRKPSMFRTTRLTALLLIAGLVVPARAAAAGIDFDAGAGDLPAPTVRAKAAIIYNPTTRQVLWEDHAQDQLSIASLTKMMTAIVFMEQHPDLTREVVVANSDVRRASITYLRPQERVTVNDVLHLALIASDNGAARVLARVSPWGTVGFIERMNEKASELGLWNTRYTDPSGLGADNVSSAYDLSRLITYVSRNEQIGQIMRKQSYRIRTNRRRVTIRSTNKLLGGDLDVRAGKTGYIRKAGFCLVALLQLPHGDPVAVVILGAQSDSGRFREARRLIDWLTTQARALVAPAVQD